MSRSYWERWKVCAKCCVRALDKLRSEEETHWRAIEINQILLVQTERAHRGRLPWVRPEPIFLCAECNYNLELIAISGSSKGMTREPGMGRHTIYRSDQVL